VLLLVLVAGMGADGGQHASSVDAKNAPFVCVRFVLFNIFLDHFLSGFFQGLFCLFSLYRSTK